MTEFKMWRKCVVMHLCLPAVNYSQALCVCFPPTFFPKVDNFQEKTLWLPRFVFPTALCGIIIVTEENIKSQLQ